MDFKKEIDKVTAKTSFSLTYNTKLDGRPTTDLAGLSTNKYEAFNFWIYVTTSDGRTSTFYPVMVNNKQCKGGGAVSVVGGAVDTYSYNHSLEVKHLYTASAVRALFTGMGDCYT